MGEAQRNEQAATAQARSHLITKNKNMEPKLELEPVHKNWLDAEGNPAGGVSTGIGFTISWQRGSLEVGRNGAFLLEVLGACEHQLLHYQSSKFACPENAEALSRLREAIHSLEQRRSRRQDEGKLGTHKL